MPEGMPGRRFLRHLALDGSRRYLDASTLFRADEMSRLFQDDALEQLAACDPWAESLSHLARKRAGDWISAAQYCDLNNYLPLDVLTKVDRMTMAHSIEARPPLLDHHLVEFAATIPARLRLRDGTTKYLFKQAMRGILPDEIIDRPKHGFAVPLGAWFRGELVGLRAGSAVLGPLPAPRPVQRRVPRTTAPAESSAVAMSTSSSGRSSSFELWCQRFLDSPSGSSDRLRARRDRPQPAIDRRAAQCPDMSVRR